MFRGEFESNRPNTIGSNGHIYPVLVCGNDRPGKYRYQQRLSRYHSSALSRRSDSWPLKRDYGGPEIPPYVQWDGRQEDFTPDDERDVRELRLRVVRFHCEPG